MLKLSFFFSKFFEEKKSPRKTSWLLLNMSPLKFGHEIFSSTFLPFALHLHNSFGKVFSLNSFSKTLHFNHTILLVCKNAKTWFKFPSSLLTLTTLLSVQKLKLWISYQTWVKFHSSLFTLTFLLVCKNLNLGLVPTPPK